MRRSYFPGFRTSYRAVILFWLIVLLIIFGIYFFAPSVFFRVMQSPYQETPFVDTPPSYSY